MVLKSLSDTEVLSRLKNLVQSERELLSDILDHLLEVEDRRLHLAEGYSSVFEYAVSVLQYSEAQAYRRIVAMRVLREVPAVKDSIENGSLNLSQLTQAKRYFKFQSENATALSQDEKINLLGSLENKSSRETEKIMARLQPEAVMCDKERVIRSDLIEIKFVASDRLMEKLNRFKELESHVIPNPNYAELFERLVDLALAKKEKTLNSVREEQIVSTLKKPCGEQQQDISSEKNSVPPRPHLQSHANRTLNRKLDHVQSLSQSGEMSSGETVYHAHL